MLNKNSKYNYKQEKDKPFAEKRIHWSGSIEK
jgi:hypothetical protein